MTMSAKTTILFDLDGTLLNSLTDLTDSTNFALGSLGFPARSITEIRSFVGNGVYRLIQAAVPADASQAAIDQCFKVMKEHYAVNMYHTTAPYPKINELLTTLNDQQYKLGVISNKYDAAVKELCQKWFPLTISLAVGESAVVTKKPSPDGVLSAIEQFHAQLSEVIYIGDSEVDIQTAQNAHVTSVGVTWGFRDRAILEKAGVDYIIDTPLELLSLLNDAK